MVNNHIIHKGYIKQLVDAVYAYDNLEDIIASCPFNKPALRVWWRDTAWLLFYTRMYGRPTIRVQSLKGSAEILCRFDARKSFNLNKTQCEIEGDLEADLETPKIVEKYKRSKKVVIELLSRIDVKNMKDIMNEYNVSYRELVDIIKKRRSYYEDIPNALYERADQVLWRYKKVFSYAASIEKVMP